MAFHPNGFIRMVATKPKCCFTFMVADILLAAPTRIVVSVSQLAKNAGISALSINYRLAPEHPYPAAIEDCAKVYEWLLSKGFLPNQICFGGDSVGGGCVVGTLTYLRDKNIELPKMRYCTFPLGGPYFQRTFISIKR